MVDPLKERLEKLRKIKDSAHRRADLYTDIAKMDDKHTARSLGALQKAPAPGKKLQKIGFLMLWVPEPTGVTCAVGGPMIVAGNNVTSDVMVGLVAWYVRKFENWLRSCRRRSRRVQTALRPYPPSCSAEVRSRLPAARHVPCAARPVEKPGGFPGPLPFS